MKSLKCTIFNVEHGLCAFIKSPNGYGLLVDCGSRSRFSPIKWIRQNYSVTTAPRTGFKYYRGRRFAECVISHLHADHFSDIGSLKDKDRPRTLTRDKETLKFVGEKIREASEEGDARRATILQEFKNFSDGYTEDVNEKPGWGFDFYEKYHLPIEKAEGINDSRDKIINNRSFIIGLEYAGKKILLPGDIESEGWLEALKSRKLQNIISGTNFFIASHHGHKSGFTQDILHYSDKPDIFIISAKSGDGHISTAYSDPDNSHGYRINGECEKSHSVSTRKRHQTVEITINSDGSTAIDLLCIEDNLNENQIRLRKCRTRQATRGW